MTRTRLVGRRHVLAGGGATLALAALAGCAPRIGRPAGPPRLALPALKARTDRITAITVCTRPFRAKGPRLDVERLAEKTVVHNYGHGGSGWSLSWGSSAIATGNALATGERDIAVIGCGALGLTSALLLQRAGARVTIYAKDIPPNVRSSLATGVWSPDSRICLAEHATPEFRATWEGMTRASFRAYQSLLGLPGRPVEYFEHYAIADAGARLRPAAAPVDGRAPFATTLARELVTDILPHGEDLAPGTHPFGARTVRRNIWMMFNLNEYTRLLVSDFLASGGKIEIVEFHSPADFAALPQQTLVNATGYGARALLKDESLTPVRGQLARMIPQPGIDYGLYYKGSAFVPRRDGMVFQLVGDDDYYGFNDATAAPDRAEAELAVTTIAQLFP